MDGRLLSLFPDTHFEVCFVFLSVAFLCSTHPESGSIDKFVDGSMEADLPMQQISELFNINHFIVSQVMSLRQRLLMCIHMKGGGVERYSDVFHQAHAAAAAAVASIGLLVCRGAVVHSRSTQ